MTHDYRRGAPAPMPKRREPKPCFFWFVLGGVLGAFAVGLAWTNNASPPANESEQSTRQVRNESADPSFYFYDILPEIEVAVPEEEALPPASQPPLPQTVRAEDPQPEAAEASSRSQSDAGGTYVVQVGSFRHAGEARRLKERLGNMDIQAHIQTVTINNTDTYHRVRTGPWSSRAQIGQIRHRLSREGLESITIKAK